MSDIKWELKGQREVFGDTLVKLGQERSDIIAASADLSSSVKTSCDGSSG